MKLSDIYRNSRRSFSFEFFPPKTPEGEIKLFDTIRELKALKPSFVSVTYGAMGTTRTNTRRIVSRIKQEIGIEAAAHLTCVTHTREEMIEILRELKEFGIENIVALRGDMPKGETEFKPVEGGFSYAGELVRLIRNDPEFSSAFSLAVAGYPEGHVECRSKELDLEHLKQKVDFGADIIITQLFFDNRDYFSFVERIRRMDIHIPVVAGIMPITHGGQIQKFAGMCGAKIPQDLLTRMQNLGEDQSAVEALGIEYATKQCEELLKSGIPGIHFYTLNKSRATREIYNNLGLAAGKLS